MEKIKKLFLKLNQYFCRHDFKVLWMGKFGSLLFEKRFSYKDIKVIVCVKCKKTIKK